MTEKFPGAPKKPFIEKIFPFLATGIAATTVAQGTVERIAEVKEHEQRKLEKASDLQPTSPDTFTNPETKETVRVEMPEAPERTPENK